MNDTCSNCKFLNKHRQMVNLSYICNFHGLTTKPENLGCYKIQFSKINEINS